MPGAPSLIDHSEFEKCTALRFGKSRRNLKAIDDKLKECKNLGAKLPDQRLIDLSLLVEACHAWLQLKAEKTSAREEKGKRETLNTATRRVHVENLLRQAQRRFAYERFEVKKQRARQGRFNPTGKSLEGGYMPERVQFNQQRTDLRARGQYGTGVTISPIGGSFVHEIHTMAAISDHNIMRRDADFDAFTIADYQAYQRELDVGTRNSMYVHYMRKEERLDNMLTIKDGRLMYRGALFSTDIRDTIYVMDLYGNMFFQNITKVGRLVPDPSGQVFSQYNHSSLNAGNDVICAGMITAKDGVLLTISNESGHYMPNHLNLEECVRELAHDGLNTGSTQVFVMTSHTTYGPWSAHQFLQNPANCLSKPPQPWASARPTARHATQGS